MANKTRKLPLRRKAEGYLVGLLLDLANKKKMTLYELAQKAKIARSSIYHFDKYPWKLLPVQLDELRLLEGKSEEEFAVTTNRKIVKLGREALKDKKPIVRPRKAEK